ncbi:hypothetical protein [Acrocarpospora sp. B8E8]|uniref:hypothetical protein n=1 Tax=Acrocarpospora sp. B8E8 TaxID=3153572 RepID=UPI00325C4AEF
MSDLWDVPDDLWAVLQRRSRWNRTLLLKVDGEPLRKGRLGARSAAAIQKQLIGQMIAYRRHPYTGPIALDLHAVAARKNPPSIHQTAKYLLDVLGNADASLAQPRRRSVLYRDDRQVKYLYVSLDQAWNRDRDRSDGSTHLIARPGRDVTADFRDAHQLRLNASGEEEEDYDNERNPFWCPDLPEDDPDWDPPIDTPRGQISVLESYLEESHRFYSLMRLQDSLLARNDAILTSALSSYLDRPPHTKEDQWAALLSPESKALSLKTRRMARNLLLANPLTVRLPALPQANMASSDFTREVSERLGVYLARSPPARHPWWAHIADYLDQRARRFG